MPELSRFFGIIIRMYVESGSHHGAHFHAYYQDSAAVFSIDTATVIAGDLPLRQRRLVEAWAEIHREELVQNWVRLQGGSTRIPIKPLE